MIAHSGGVRRFETRAEQTASIECRLSRGGRVLSVAVCGRNERNRRELRRQLAVALLAHCCSPSPPPVGAAWLRRIPRCTLGRTVAATTSTASATKPATCSWRVTADLLVRCAQFRGSIAATL